MILNLMENRTQKIGEILLGQGLIQEHQLEDALSEQKNDQRRLGELLVAKGLIKEEVLYEILAELFQVPFIQESDILPEEEAVRAVPLDLIEGNHILPLTVEGKNLTVATSDPLNFDIIQKVQYKSGFFVRVVMTTPRAVEAGLQDVLDTLNTSAAVKALKGDSGDHSNIRELVHAILNRAIRERASDVHFEPLPEFLRVRFRIDGVLHERNTIPKELERNILSRIKIVSGMDVAENRRPQDGRTSFENRNKEYDIRVSSLPDVQGENLVLRILSKEAIGWSFKHLGVSDNDQKTLHRLLRLPYGLILVTGPTGAGKTTTLYSMLNLLNKTERKIISVEEPVEYQLKGVTQTAVNPHIDYTFANAIRQILRHDPDVIMVGEIRDLPTAEMAVRAALTGHLVLSTMHTNTAAGAITRLLEMDIEPFLISSALSGVLAQRLVRSVCPYCVQESRLPGNKRQKLSRLGVSIEDVKEVKAAGCARCHQSGYRGREGLFEILEADSEIQAMILKRCSEKEIMERAQEKGMADLREAALQKFLKKQTTWQEIMRVVAFE